MSTYPQKSRDALNASTTTPHPTTPPMTRFLKTVLLGAIFVAGLANTAAAQRPTPEGTTISNTASASYTDSRGNTYAGVASNTVDLLVGFKAAPAVNDPSATPAPNSTSFIPFVLTNTGNGVDRFQLDSLIGASGVTLTGSYRYSGTTYTSLAALNAVISLVPIDTAGGTTTSLTVDVEYSVATGAGSFDAWFSSARDLTGDTRTTSGTATINAPVLTYDVTVAAVAPGTGATPVTRETGGTYYEEFTVTNSSNVPANFTLAPTQSQAGALVYTGLVVQDNTGATLAGAETGLLGVGSSVTVRLAYTVHNNTAAGWASGTQNTLTLTATGVAPAGAASDNDVTVIAAVTPTGTLASFVKAATDTLGAALGATVTPGTYIDYTITVTQGATAATSLVITDVLPAEVLFVSATGVTGTWTSITESGGTVTATYNGTLAAAASASFRIRVRIR